MKTALITGITGQDGSYLADLLLRKGYVVHGIVRRASTFNTGRIDRLYRDKHDPGARLFLHYGDLTDGSSLRRILQKTRPDEIYNLGAQSHVKVSFDQSEYTADVVATGTLRLLEALRDYFDATADVVRLYQAGSSEMFGVAKPPQDERPAFYMRSPYAAAKVAAYGSVDYSLGDPGTAKRELGWTPGKVQELVRMMVEADLELARQESPLLNAAHSVPARVGF